MCGAVVCVLGLVACNLYLQIQLICSKKDITEAALEEVEADVSEKRKRGPFTHFVCLPFLTEENGSLVSKIEAFKTKVNITTKTLSPLVKR